MTSADENTVLSVRDLRVHFLTKTGTGKAVDGVSFDLKRGETLGLVGESGCGKSVTALSIVGLNPKPASRIVSGQILFRGEDLVQKSSKEYRAYRGKHLSMVLQDPMTALNPAFNIEDQLGEPLRIHQKLQGRKLKQQVIELLRKLRIATPEDRLKHYPHQFSGGMRQRVVGAIALSCEPEILIADEPTTSLDVTVEAAYMELLKEIQREMKLSILYITHDFGVVSRMCDRVAVMYAGRVVEIAPTWELLDNPAHPYGEALVRSVPDVREHATRLRSIEGQPPSIFRRRKGCPFAPRCDYTMSRCETEYPPEREINPGHTTSCWRYV